MPAYLIAIVDVKDPEEFEIYRAAAPESTAKYGGKYVARGGKFEVLEGEASLNRVSIVEFESIEKAKAWWSSPEYEKIKSHRHKSATTTIIVTETL
ncbi:MAG: DUF1330 domain-containing protein [Chloroflexota bacterium]